jgi:Spy/CpxP family protein refolding chaperone
MKIRFIVLTIATAALIAAPGALMAQSGPGGPACDGSGPHGAGMHGGRGGPGGDGMFGGPGGPGLLRMLPRLAERLDLSDDQQARIHATLDAELPAIHDLMEQAATARQSFHETHGPGDYDEVAYRVFFEDQARIQVETHLLGARAVSMVWQVLTPEQQDQVRDLLDLMGPGRGGKHHGGGRVGSGQ